MIKPGHKIEMLEYISKKLLKKVETLQLNTMQPHDRMIIFDRLLREIVEEEKIMVSEKDLDLLIKEINDDSFGLGPVSLLFNDPQITEVMINNFDEIYIEKNGTIKKTAINFRNNDHIKNLIDKILSPLGLKIDESSPMADARLNDGSRVNIVLNPISIKDLVVTIRKFNRDLMEMEDLIKEGTLSNKISDFIKLCVEGKLNIIISGGTSTGKTTFLNIISNFISSSERIITIEETAELNLRLPHVIRLEGRPPNLEGRGEVTIRDIVRNALRMRPDRMVVGEIRGLEAVDVLGAMNTGHNGSMTTVHANSPKDLITRLETMLLMAGLNLNPSSARRIIASSVDIIIHLEKLKNGRRVMQRISEVVDKNDLIGENTVLDIQDIYRSEGHQSGKCEFIHTGYLPTFMERLCGKEAGFNFTDI